MEKNYTEFVRNDGMTSAAAKGLRKVDKVDAVDIVGGVPWPIKRCFHDRWKALA